MDALKTADIDEYDLDIIMNPNMFSILDPYNEMIPPELRRTECLLNEYDVPKAIRILRQIGNDYVG